MAIILYPVVSTAPSGLDCDTQNVIAPAVTQVYDVEDVRRMRSISCQQGQKFYIDWTMVDRHGRPISLISCGFPAGNSSSSGSVVPAPSVVMKIRENLSIGESNRPAGNSFAGDVVDADAGTVRFLLEPDSTNLPGIYFAEAAVLDEDGNMLFSNVFYLTINRGQFGGDTVGGPPSLAEIRLHLRDNGAATNLLLDDIAYDDAEIALAISRPIMEWNETPPPLNRRYTTQDFPYRFMWLEGICGNLYLMSAENFRRNSLRYQASGITVSDQEKDQMYEQAAQLRLQNWRKMMITKKASINLESGYGSDLSPYYYL